MEALWIGFVYLVLLVLSVVVSAAALYGATVLVHYAWVHG